jgi:hypothetical protein
VVRRLRGERAIDERRASFERFMAMRAEREAQRPGLSWTQMLRRAQPVALAVMFGVMGWTLAGLGIASVGRAALWWGLMFSAALTFGSTPPALTGLAFSTRATEWMALPLFATLTLLIQGGTKVPPLRAPWHRP